MNGVVEFSETPSDLVSFQTIATYRCNSGFGLSGGDRVRTCIGSSSGGGEWTGSTPLCEGVYNKPSNTMQSYIPSTKIRTCHIELPYSEYLAKFDTNI